MVLVQYNFLHLSRCVSEWASEFPYSKYSVKYLKLSCEFSWNFQTKLKYNIFTKTAHNVAFQMHDILRSGTFRRIHNFT